MSSIFSIFNIGSQALFAQQTALHITGQNIANANTENYVRQRAELRESTPVDHSPGQLGTGVNVNEIIRIKNEFTDFQIRRENQSMGYLEEKNIFLQQIENIFNEPSENGLNAAFSGFYNALSELQNGTEDTSSRSFVTEQARALSDVFNDIAGNLEKLKENLNENIGFKVDEINSITDEIAKLNDQIIRTESGGQQNANDLRNRRDGLVRDLSKLGDVFVKELDSGSIDVNFGDQLLVTGVHQIKIEGVLDENNNQKIIVENVQSILNVNNGSLKAVLEVRDDILADYKDKLDTLANSFIDSINSIHVGGVGVARFTQATSENSVDSSSVPIRNAGLDFDMSNGSFVIARYNSASEPLTPISETTITIDPFVDTLEDIVSQIDAVSGFNATITSDNKVQVNVTGSNDFFTFISSGNPPDTDSSGFLKAIGLNTFFKGSDASTIAVADYILSDPDKIAAAKNLAPGDNQNVVLMVETQNTGLIDGASFQDYYAGLIGGLGVQREVTSNREETQSLILKTLSERQQAESGVSFDEEAINLLKFQRGYQAAARFINVVDGLIETLISIV